MHTLTHIKPVKKDRAKPLHSLYVVSPYVLASRSSPIRKLFRSFPLFPGDGAVVVTRASLAARFYRLPVCRKFPLRENVPGAYWKWRGNSSLAWKFKRNSLFIVVRGGKQTSGKCPLLFEFSVQFSVFRPNCCLMYSECPLAKPQGRGNHYCLVLNKLENGV